MIAQPPILMGRGRSPPGKTARTRSYPAKVDCERKRHGNVRREATQPGILLHPAPRFQDPFSDL
jgi:hypothetical protein